MIQVFLKIQNFYCCREGDFVTRQLSYLSYVVFYSVIIKMLRKHVSIIYFYWFQRNLRKLLNGV